MKYIKAGIFCTITLIWMVTIFCFSAQSAEASSAMSSPIAQTVVDIVYPSVDTMDSDRHNELLDLWSLIIRKGAHLTEYTLLGVFLSLAWSSVRGVKTGDAILICARSLKLQLCALLTGIVYAALDEFHQLFVAGRSGQLSDILLDSSGVAIGVLLVFLIAQIKSVCRSKRQTL